MANNNIDVNKIYCRNEEEYIPLQNLCDSYSTIENEYSCLNSIRSAIDENSPLSQIMEQIWNLKIEIVGRDDYNLIFRHLFFQALQRKRDNLCYYILQQSSVHTIKELYKDAIFLYMLLRLKMHETMTYILNTVSKYPDDESIQHLLTECSLDKNVKINLLTAISYFGSGKMASSKIVLKAVEELKSTCNVKIHYFAAIVHIIAYIVLLIFTIPYRRGKIYDYSITPYSVNYYKFLDSTLFIGIICASILETYVLIAENVPYLIRMCKLSKFENKYLHLKQMYNLNYISKMARDPNEFSQNLHLQFKKTNSLVSFFLIAFVENNTMRLFKIFYSITNIMFLTCYLIIYIKFLKLTNDENSNQYSDELSFSIVFLIFLSMNSTIRMISTFKPFHFLKIYLITLIIIIIKELPKILFVTFVIVGIYAYIYELFIYLDWLVFKNVSMTDSVKDVTHEGIDSIFYWIWCLGFRAFIDGAREVNVKFLYKYFYLFQAIWYLIYLIIVLFIIKNIFTAQVLDRYRIIKAEQTELLSWHSLNSTITIESKSLLYPLVKVLKCVYTKLGKKKLYETIRNHGNDFQQFIDDELPNKVECKIGEIETRLNQHSTQLKNIESKLGALEELKNMKSKLGAIEKLLLKSEMYK